MKNEKIAYLASEYPAISHTFIFREIQSLRKEGVTIKTASIRKPQNLEKMSVSEKQDYKNTFYIKDVSFSILLYSHLHLFLSRPLVYCKFILKALSLTTKKNLSLFKRTAYIGEAGILAFWIKKKSIGHVHIHFGNPAATVAMLGSFLEIYDYSLSIHGPDVFYDINNNMLMEKIYYASSVRCISFYCRSQLERLVPHDMWSKFHIVRCGVDTTVFSTQAPPNNTVPEMLCLGRLVSAKGQHVLINALRLLKEKGILFHLTIVGDGNDRTSLEMLTSEFGLNASVQFTGAVGQEMVHEFYNNADIFVLPSFAEGVPVVLMEAMAKGIPVISTNIMGIPELIENGKDGILIAPSDVDGLAHSLEVLLSNSELRAHLGNNGRRKVENLYNLDSNCKLMNIFFKDTV